MKILVTGWNERNKSFIPKAVATHLLNCGHEVDGYVWDEDWSESDETLYGWSIDPDLGKSTSQTIYRDIYRRNFEHPLSYYDLVIHLGGLSSTTEENVEKVMRHNFDFSLWLLNKCQQHQIPLHYASSASVYGNLIHFQEEGEMRPLNAYAFSKYMFDRIVIKYANTFKSPVIGFRYFNVYGNIQQERHKENQMSVFSKWYDQARMQNYIELFEETAQCRRDFINIKDVCNIHEKMLNVDYKGVVNIGTGSATSYGEIVNLFSEFIGVEAHEIPFPNKIKNQYQKLTEADITTLKSLIGDYEFITARKYFESEFGA
jgi:ADP-L-glycero-D-manno-heptose 6-epimerase